MMAIWGEDEEEKCSFLLVLKKVRIHFLVPIYFLKFFLEIDFSCSIMLFRHSSLLLGPEKSGDLKERRFTGELGLDKQ